MADPQFDNSDMGNPIYSGDANTFNWNNAMYGNGIGDMIGAGLMGWGMGNYNNPASSGMPYLNQIPGMLNNTFSPYINAGMSALPQLQKQYGNLINNPTGIMNGIGKTFQQSPGYQFQTQQAMNAANRAAAAGGMLGTPQEQQNIAGTVNGMANQDYYNYLNHGLGLYQTGLQGMGDLYHTGYNASSNLGEDLASSLMSQANLAYAGQADQNQMMQGGLGDIGGLISGGLGAIFGA